MIKKRWVSDNTMADVIKKLTESGKFNNTLARILVNRSLTDEKEIEEFLNPSLLNLFDPFLLKDMDKAVSRIKSAKENNETVCIYGDYDVDGVTASAILTIKLREELKVFNYIPDRETEGYGVNKGAIDKIKDKGATLIITVDCGITSVDEVNYAKEQGIDFIITDHHTCPELLPKANAVINPKRGDGNYPFSELCGAGVALKLVCALGEKNLESYLAICAIGTVADIVPLLSENRIIVYYGLKYLKENKFKKIEALARESGINIKDITTTVLGYNIAPRINAAGRMGSAKDALTLFLSSDDSEILEKARLLNELNIKRQETEKGIYEEAKKIVESYPDIENQRILVISKKGWHEGVIGIVASKITEEYNKPCVLLSENEEYAKGSSRSIKGINIYDALKSAEKLLIRFGGHELAAGLTLETKNIDALRCALNSYAENQMDGKPYASELFIDAELLKSDITLEFAESLKALEPYGMGNKEPVLLVKDAKIKKSMAFKENKHLLLNLNKEEKNFDAVAFNMGSFAQSLREGDEIYVAGSVNINDYRGIKSFQMKVKDIKRKV